MRSQARVQRAIVDDPALWAKGLPWLHKALEYGVLAAAYLLGECYEKASIPLFCPPRVFFFYRNTQGRASLHLTGPPLYHRRGFQWNRITKPLLATTFKLRKEAVVSLPDHDNCMLWTSSSCTAFCCMATALTCTEPSPPTLLLL